MVAERLRVKPSKSWGTDKGRDDEYYNLLKLQRKFNSIYLLQQRVTCYDLKTFVDIALFQEEKKS